MADTDLLPRSRPTENSNNAAEKAIRPVALEKKELAFAGSDSGRSERLSLSLSLSTR
jgi:hypothetical protein